MQPTRDIPAITRARPKDEAVLLAGAILRGHAKTIAPLVDPGDFADEADQVVWRKLRALIAGERPHDVLNLRASLRFREPWVDVWLDYLVGLDRCVLGPLVFARLDARGTAELLRRLARNVRWYRAHPCAPPPWYLERLRRAAAQLVPYDRARQVARDFTFDDECRTRALLLEAETL